MHGRARPDDVLEVVGFRNRETKPAHFVAKVPVPHRTLDGKRNHVEIERLGDEVISAGSNGSDCGVETAVGGHHDDRQIGTVLAKVPAQLEAPDTGHTQVRDDCIEFFACRRVSGLRGARRELALESAKP